MATKHTVCNANLQTIGENMDDICIILIIYGGIIIIMTHHLIDVESLLWLHLFSKGQESQIISTKYHANIDI